MPIRFSTQAANEDKLRDDEQPRSTTPETPPAAGSARRTRQRAEQPARRDSATAQRGEVKAGKDINAAAFIKDKDSGQT